jgi:hypothetical protein
MISDYSQSEIKNQNSEIKKVRLVSRLLSLPGALEGNGGFE